MPESKNRANILLIQNNESTLQVVRQALAANKIRCRLQVVGVGKSTLSYLLRNAPYAKAPVPDLVLCDLVEATSSSVKIIEAIKSDQQCKSIPLVYLIGDLSERALERILGSADQDASFSPVELDSFLKALNTFTLERFTKAISLLESLGSILVKMPGTIDENQS